MNDNNLEVTHRNTVNAKFDSVTVPSLQDVAMAKLVTTIYMQNDVLQILKQNHCLEKVKTNLHEKLLRLPLPTSLMNRALHVCEFVIYQGSHTLGLMIIDNYDKCRCGFNFKIPVDYFYCLSFNMNCTVDKLKTLSSLSEFASYPQHKLFIAACHICSEKLVTESWKKISEFPSENFENEWEIYENLKISCKFEDCTLNKYWLYFVNGKISNFGIVDLVHGLNSNEFLFEYGLRYFNFEAVKYFDQILSENEKTRNLERWLDMSFEFTSNLNKNRIECFDIYFYLLSKLNDKDQQIDQIRSNFEFIIQPLILNSFYQKYFQPIKQLVWPSLDEEDLVLIFFKIFDLISKKNEIAFYLFKELWPQTNEHFKLIFFGDFISNLNRRFSYDCDLFEPNFFEIVQLIFSIDHDKDKLKHLNSLVHPRELLNRIWEDLDYLNQIDEFLAEILPENEIPNFKKLIFNPIHGELVREWISVEGYESINQFLDWLFPLEIEYFKRNFLSEKCILEVMIIKNSNYEKPDKFLNWFFNSCQIEIKKFKKSFAYNLEIKFEDWDAYMKFVAWCFDSEGEVRLYKKFSSRFNKLAEVAFKRIAKDDFDYINKLLKWCLSPRMIKKFKMKFFDSKLRLEILDELAWNMYKYEGYPTSHEMGRKLAKWFGSVGPMRIRKMKSMYRRRKVLVVKHAYFRYARPMFLQFLKDFLDGLENRHKLALLRTH